MKWLLLVGLLSLCLVQVLGKGSLASPKRFKIPDGLIGDKLIRKTLYRGGVAFEFQALCPPPPRTPVKPSLTEDPFCAGWNQKEMDVLHKAQRRTKEFQETLALYYDLTPQLLLVSCVILMGSFLIVKGHFTLRPYMDSRTRDPTSGLSYFVYSNMKWETIEVRTTVQTEEEYKDDSHVVDDEDDVPPEGWPSGYIPFHEQPFPRVMVKKRRLTKFEYNLQRHQNNDMFD